jgi:hypothetical protein
MSENPALREARALYDDKFLAAEYEELRQPTQRAYMLSLILAGLSNGPIATTIGTHSRTAFRPVDAPRLDTSGATLEQIGNRLLEILTPDQQNALRAGVTSMPVGERATVLAQAYRDSRVRAMDRWARGENLHDRRFQLDHPDFAVLIRTPIELYRKSRDTLNAALNENRIAIPGIESPDAPGGPQLQRREYMALLSLVWSGGAEEVRKAAAAGLPALRTLLVLRAPVTAAALDVYDRLVFEELGPTETLRTLGISLGPTLTKAYVEGRRGRPERIAPPERPLTRPRRGRPSERE